MLLALAALSVVAPMVASAAGGDQHAEFRDALLTSVSILVDLHTLITDDPGAAASAAAPAGPRTEPGAPTAPAPTDTGGRCCETADGTSLPVATVRRLACEAGIIPAVLNGDGVVVDFGRGRRLASPDQRKVLRTMYTTCAFNECTTPFDRCEIHHVDPWGPPSNGRTDISKLVPACQRHHHAIHDHHLRLSVDPESRSMTVTHPDGTQVVHPLIDRRRRPPPGDARTA